MSKECLRDRRFGRRFVACAALLASALACGGYNVGDREGTREPSPAEHAEGANSPELRTLAYDCDDGRYVVAHLDPDADQLWLFLPGEAVQLPRVPSGSGAKYSDETITLWSKGNEAVLELADGTTVECTENRRRSRIEDAKLRGNEFWATGNEPGWTLEIGRETTVLVTDYGERRLSFPTPEPQVDAEARRTEFRATVDDTDIVIRLLGEECKDSMSGEAYETTVEIELGAQRLMGCGLALH
jgi:putative lipoprotein